MPNTILILNSRAVNEGRIFDADILIKDGRIEKIGTGLSHLEANTVIDAKGQYLLPGVIDDQVHFREPGLTHKANIYSEAKAAVAGGTTSFMEMPNTNPQTLTQALLEDKYQIGARTSLANYSFFMGVSNDNLEEALKTNRQKVCGLKIFMGSSTGNMLVDNEKTLEAIFSRADMLIATHCEHEPAVKQNEAIYKEKYGDAMPIHYHVDIRSVEACYRSSSFAVSLAKKHGTRLHILHISTGDELALFSNALPLEQKRITSEVCVHHLWFSRDDYAQLGTLIKCNPAIKEASHREQLWAGLLDNRLDIIATDHAPHTWQEKDNNYWKAPSGLPLVQHSLLMMLQRSKEGKISMEKVVEKMCHTPAICFQISQRGYIREGYWADLVLVDPNQATRISKENIHYHCGWSPLEGTTLDHRITHTFVSGHLAYQHGIFHEEKKGERLLFERN